MFSYPPEGEAMGQALLQEMLELAEMPYLAPASALSA